MKTASSGFSPNKNIFGNLKTRSFFPVIGWILALLLFIRNISYTQNDCVNEQYHESTRLSMNQNGEIMQVSTKDSCPVLLDNVREKLKLLNDEKIALRRRLGELSCECNKIGPTGGFCLDPTLYSVGGNGFLAYEMSKRLYEFFTGKTVIDLGAGLGQYEKYFNELREATYGHGGPKSIIPYDGAENIELVTKGYVKWADLTEPQDLGTYDWVMSLEVAEHISKQNENVFLQNLHRHNTEGIIMSWAVKNQGGHFHINEQNSDYVIPKVTSLGYIYDEKLSQELRILGNMTHHWFSKTVYVFHRK